LESEGGGGGGKGCPEIKHGSERGRNQNHPFKLLGRREPADSLGSGRLAYLQARRVAGGEAVMKNFKEIGLFNHFHSGGELQRLKFPDFQTSGLLMNQSSAGKRKTEDQAY